MTNRKYNYLIIAVFSCIIISSSAKSDEFRLVPSITAQEEYNSNVFVSSDNIKNDIVTTFSPALEIVERTERLDASVKIQLDHINYADNRDLNATDQSYRGKLRYRVTPKFNFSVDAGYTTDSSPDRDLETTGLVSSALRRERTNTAESLFYQISEQSAFLLTYAFGKETFEKEHSDTLVHDVSAGFTRDFSKYIPTLKGYANFGYSYFDISDTQSNNQFDNRMDILLGTTGASLDFSELWGTRIDAGVHYTKSRFSESRFNQTTTDKKTDIEWDWIGKASLDYKGECVWGDFTYVREIRPSSWYNTAAVRNTLMLNVWYKMTYELSVALNTGYLSNKSDQAELLADIIDTKSLYVIPHIRYDLAKDISIDASYNYTIYYDKVADTEADRHLLFLRLSIQHFFFE